MAFDVDSFARTAGPVRTDDLGDLASEFARRRLSDDGLRCLRYMHDVESHTVCYLRDLLMTSSHRDPRITTFLTVWNYEEHSHGVALGSVLAAHGEPHGDERNAAVRDRQGRLDSVKPVLSAAASSLVGNDFVAVHMSWGAVNEWTTRSGYARLIERERHPALTTLLTRIMAQESRHIAFYASEARARLAASRRARLVTRWALRRLWSPVGTGVMPAEETAFVLGYLLAGEPGRREAERIDAQIDRLPGQAGLGLLTGAARRYAPAS
ncbi:MULTISPECIES: hypothetical protein [unclassified Pseudofrankia]|uniref:hypothetical protein n=1 Tax=unclassified Pseudofrankia TaxID=2994372 RepID=UPI0008D99B72|nr:MULTISPECIES: hypothetical protein [unclassified Pseudofrankia]MDT3445695.1 ferritin-like domain-containing protein [Pseudofrankia sp. BMG5.37]OHV42491.1 hypothetical protein BCD48_31460 [Pseudofrankia sp. BMG5.36]